MYNQLELLGRGTFADVFKVEKDGQFFAKKCCTYKKYMYNTEREKNVMERLNGLSSHPGHKHIVHLVDSFENKEKGWDIVMELYEGSLFELLPLDEDQAIDMAKHITLALIFMDEHNIAHCDLRPENILYKESKKTNSGYHFSITDFGNCLEKGEYKETEIQSRNYRCVENILKSPMITSCDMTSLGCILYETITEDYLVNIKKEDGGDKHVLYILNLIGKKILKQYDCSKLSRFEEFIKDVEEEGLLYRDSFTKNKEIIDFIIRTILPFEDQRLQARDAILHSLFKEDFEDEIYRV
jgi:serine/threonine protein kinase